MARLLPATALAAALIAAAASTSAQQAPLAPDTAPAPLPRAERPPPASLVFDVPVLVRTLAGVPARIRSGRTDAALTTLDRLIEQFPDLGDLYLLKGLAAAARGDADTAFAALDRAVDLGHSDAESLKRDPSLALLSTDPRHGALIARAERRGPARPSIPAYLQPATPARVRESTALVTPRATEWDKARARLLVRVATPSKAERPPVLGGIPAPVASLLNRRFARGEAAGNLGDLYDNRDRDHSSLLRENFGQIAFVEYAEDAKARRLDYGPNTELLFDRITIGNSSTALTSGPLWRSQTRQLLTTPQGPPSLALQYANNHLYVYPEHRDHDPEHGDTFPANTPYVLISQGSSYSDKAFLRALAVILAALRPETKEAARQANLIAPTLQLVLRRAMAPKGKSAEHYLSGEAHPSVFDGKRIDLQRAVAIAYSLRPETLPGQVRLRVTNEEHPLPGLDLFSGGLGERLFDTPSAIARIHRSTAKTRRLRVSAAGTTDPNGLPLRFEWRVLRGEGERIRITPLDDNAREAEIEIDWHDSVSVPGRPDLTGHRVDIGVFAWNGTEWSAPAFVTMAYPPNQQRVYREGRPLSIAYAAPGDESAPYADPRLFLRQGWQDRYAYAEDGTLLGWTRTLADGTEERYTAEGLRVLEEDAFGRVLRAEKVVYARERLGIGQTWVRIDPDDALAFRYGGPEDRIGRVVEAE
ncbi:MAG: hypothetical protein AAGI34_06845 [Pseudomonadota bacterium]